MKRQFAASAVVLPALACLLAPEASAQVEFWDVIKIAEYTQDSADTQPAMPDGYAAEVVVEITDPGDISAAEVSSAKSPRMLMGDGLEWTGEEEFATQADLDMVWPGSMMYAISITAGALAPSSQGFTIPVDNYPAGAPYLTGASFGYLSGVDPALPIVITWNSPASTSSFAVFVDIFRESNGERVFAEDFIDDQSTGTTIPGGTLIAGEAYVLEIGHTNVQFLMPDPTGFNSEGVVAFENITSVAFVAGGPSGSCEGDADGSGLVDFGDITSVLNNWLQSCGP